MIYIIWFYVNPTSKRILDVFSTKEEAEKCRDYWASQLGKCYKYKIEEREVINKFNIE